MLDVSQDDSVPPHHGAIDLDEVEHGDVVQLLGKLFIEGLNVGVEILPVASRVVTRAPSVTYLAGPTEIFPLSWRLCGSI